VCMTKRPEIKIKKQKTSLASSLCSSSSDDELDRGIEEVKKTVSPERKRVTFVDDYTLVEVPNEKTNIDMTPVRELKRNFISDVN